MILEFGTQQELRLLALLMSAATLLILAGPLRIPYAILLVLGGLLLGFGPGVPKRRLRSGGGSGFRGGETVRNANSTA